MSFSPFFSFFVLNALPIVSYLTDVIYRWISDDTFKFAHTDCARNKVEHQDAAARDYPYFSTSFSKISQCMRASLFQINISLFIIFMMYHIAQHTNLSESFNSTTLHSLLLVEKFISIESNQLKAIFYVVTLFIG